MVIVAAYDFQYREFIAFLPELFLDHDDQNPTFSFILKFSKLILTGILIISAIIEVIFKIKKVKSLKVEDQIGRRRKGRTKG
ncbi:MAG: hypothetical protein GF353_24865 [Candidatus Lokiarchaeota archaeon]|nr:hypothetical protein [Candidatus Lokiarchaeota archaeon]